MDRIRAIVKNVDNTINQGKKIFFCAEDICKVIGVSKEEWDKCWVSHWEYIEPSIEEYNKFFLQNHYTEIIQGANASHEILYCTMDLLEDVLDFGYFMGIMELLETKSFYDEI